MTPYFRDVVPFASAVALGRPSDAVLSHGTTDTIMAWVNDIAMQRGAMRHYEAFQKSSKHPMTMDDLRIREASEAKAFVGYMQAEMVVAHRKEMLKVRKADFH